MVSDKVGKDIPKKKPITIPMNVAIISFIPSFSFLPFELQTEEVIYLYIYCDQLKKHKSNNELRLFSESNQRLELSVRLAMS